MTPVVIDFYHTASGTFSYLVYDPETLIGAIVDPVLDFDMASGVVSYESANKILSLVADKNLHIAWILETHAHADHLTSAQYLKHKTGASVAIGRGISKVQKTFKAVYNLSDEFNVEGEQFDQCFDDGDKFTVGNIPVTVLATPGHTNDSVTYLIGDAAFIGDTMFHPNVGTARCDFPGGDAATLYQSIQQILSLPENTRLFLCHDYPEEGREATCQVSIAQQRANNIHVNDGCSEQDFIQFRTSRDSQLAVPQLLYPSVQVNIAAGHFPKSESNSVMYLKTPITFKHKGAC